MSVYDPATPDDAVVPAVTAGATLDVKSSIHPSKRGFTVADATGEDAVLLPTFFPLESNVESVKPVPELNIVSN